MAKFEPLQGRVERAEFDIERLTRITANRLGDPIAMEGCQYQRSKNQHVERSLKEIHIETLYMKNSTIASFSRVADPLPAQTRATPLLIYFGMLGLELGDNQRPALSVSFRLGFGDAFKSVNAEKLFITAGSTPNSFLA